MKTAEQILPDHLLVEAFGYASFGADSSKREVVNNVLLKCACSYSIGMSSRHILRDLGLIYQNSDKLTDLGREYLFAAFSGGKSL